MIELNNDIIYLILNNLSINEIVNLSSSNKNMRDLIVNNYYWIKKIPNTINLVKIKPFYYYLYGYRKFKLTNKKISLNSQNYQINQDKSIRIFDIADNNTPYLIKLITPIKISGNYKINLKLKLEKNSFITNLHLITRAHQNDNTLNLFNINNYIETKSKLLSDQDYLLKLLDSNKDYSYNILDIYDQHIIRDKGWINIQTNPIYLEENQYMEFILTTKIFRFCKYSFKEIILENNNF